MIMITVAPLLLLMLADAPATAKAGAEIYANPQGSVRMKWAKCGRNHCGTVIWANAKAKADAARGGSPKLVGLQLFRNFASDGPNHWKGKVFVPDMGKSFSGEVERLDANRLEGSGCILGGLACKKQLWTRVR